MLAKPLTGSISCSCSYSMLVPRRRFAAWPAPSAARAGRTCNKGSKNVDATCQGALRYTATVNTGKVRPWPEHQACISEVKEGANNLLSAWQAREFSAYHSKVALMTQAARHSAY